MNRNQNQSASKQIFSNARQYVALNYVFSYIFFALRVTKPSTVAVATYSIVAVSIVITVAVVVIVCVVVVILVEGIGLQLAIFQMRY